MAVWAHAEQQRVKIQFEHFIIHLWLSSHFLCNFSLLQFSFEGRIWLGVKKMRELR